VIDTIKMISVMMELRESDANIVKIFVCLTSLFYFIFIFWCEVIFMGMMM
jgi:hypothetical protein